LSKKEKIYAEKNAPPKLFLEQKNSPQAIACGLSEYLP
jgi:hypothetical protein